MKTLFSIEVQGNTKRWSFHFYGELEDLVKYQSDGLNIERVHEVIPVSDKEMAKVN